MLRDTVPCCIQDAVMDQTRICDGCAALVFDEPVNRNDYYSAHCCDPGKSVMGKRRTLDVSAISRPFCIPRPVWCKGKISGGQHH